MEAQIITIGDEILIGQIIDTNSAWLGNTLNDIGIDIVQIQSIADDHLAITQALSSIPSSTNLVLLTGGLGPTKDDITKTALADFFSVELALHEATWERLQSFFAKFGRKPTDSHYQQCFLPQNAECLTNHYGTAPGMWFEAHGRIYLSMPGVPREMKGIMEKEAIPRFLQLPQRKAIDHLTLRTVGMGESNIAKILEPVEPLLDKSIKIAYLPRLGEVRVRLSARSNNRMQNQHVLQNARNEIEALLGDHIYGYEETSLETAVGTLLRSQNRTIATAESCTGGYIAHRLTSIAGASDYYLGSIISYANVVKMKELNVKKETLDTHGAVSEATVREMLLGLLDRLPADIGIAVSGIAGPGGGSPDKPVGTIWIAYGARDNMKTQKLQFGKFRETNIQLTSTFALKYIRDFLLASHF